MRAAWNPSLGHHNLGNGAGIQKSLDHLEKDGEDPGCVHHNDSPWFRFAQVASGVQLRAQANRGSWTLEKQIALCI